MGGFVGGLAGPGGSFAGGIVGTAIGQQLDDLATALKKPSVALELLKKSGIELGESTESLVGELVKANKLTAAQAVVYDELVNVVGQSTVDEIVKASQESDKLGKAVAELNRELVLGLAPTLTKLVSAAKGAAAALGPLLQRLSNILDLGGGEQLGAETRARATAGQRTDAKFGALSSTVFGSAEAKDFFKKAYEEALKNEQFNIRAARGDDQTSPGNLPLDTQDRLKEEEAARKEAERAAKKAADDQLRAAQEAYRLQMRMDRQLFENRMRLAQAVYDRRYS